MPEVCGKGALYFDPNDPEDIALKTHTILTNNVLRQKLIEEGFENVKRFSWDKMAKETYEVYKSVLNN
jgi:glycosyltransferase involved in cell wall biosynthesis